MYLDDLNEIMLSNATLGSEEIKSAHIKKIYYLVTGRNAWHSTWVQHFYKRCISTEYRDLENDAEKRRGAGTVFYIEELPALCLETSLGCFVISEINTNFPLKNYDPKNFLKIRNQCNYTKVLNCPTEQVFNGSRLSAIFKSLDSRECWKQPERKDSLFKLFLKDKGPKDFEDHSGYYAIRNSSTSGGKKNSLSWVMKTGSISGEYVATLANL
jgi:hypothetical protein